MTESSKRSHAEDEDQRKLFKSDLKQSILSEVEARYESRIAALEKQVADLHKCCPPSAPKQKPTLTKNDTVPLDRPLPEKPTFGALSFGKTEKTPDPPAKAFGSGISFGSLAFQNIKSGKNVFDDSPKSDSPSITLFGANSKFGNAFQELLTKKSFLDDDATLKSKDSINDESRQPKQQFKQVELTPVTVSTGEEDENSLYTTKCKLYELDFATQPQGWRERGAGNLHVNEAKDKLSKRLVMRLTGVHKVILNYRISKATEVIKGYQSSLTPEKFFRFTLVNLEGSPVQYMLKFKDEATRDEVVGFME